MHGLVRLRRKEPAIAAAAAAAEATTTPEQHSFYSDEGDSEKVLRDHRASQKASMSSRSVPDWTPLFHE